MHEATGEERNIQAQCECPCAKADGFKKTEAATRKALNHKDFKF